MQLINQFRVVRVPEYKKSWNAQPLRLYAFTYITSEYRPVVAPLLKLIFVQRCKTGQSLLPGLCDA
jgi:hypothetical protein